ncbi:MAG: hypothetical protein GY839_13170 [candidate division Zixibacteria bacterium]|nr:hypothetical protein [candidate division Zixibacteria bacterium]
MFYWCMTLFVLGVLAILDTVFSYGEIFRWVNSVLFLLASLGLLVRTRMMVKNGKIEKLMEEVEFYKTQISNLNLNVEKEEKEPEPVS